MEGECLQPPLFIDSADEHDGEILNPPPQHSASMGNGSGLEHLPPVAVVRTEDRLGVKGVAAVKVNAVTPQRGLGLEERASVTGIAQRGYREREDGMVASVDDGQAKISPPGLPPRRDRLQSSEERNAIRDVLDVVHGH